jgi:hypothetical protein
VAGTARNQHPRRAAARLHPIAATLGGLIGFTLAAVLLVAAAAASTSLATSAQQVAALGCSGASAAACSDRLKDKPTGLCQCPQP